MSRSMVSQTLENITDYLIPGAGTALIYRCLQGQSRSRDVTELEDVRSVMEDGLIFKCGE